MDSPNFLTKSNGVPIMSRQQIDYIGEEYVRKFQPEILTNPAPLDIDAFAELYLELDIDYKYLSHNGVYLGMMVFQNTDRIPIYNPGTQRAEYINERANTIIIDSRLLEDNQTHRYRYTMGHECGHAVFHSTVYAKGGGIPCRLEKKKTGRANTREWLDDDWMEWHANCFAAATLMPKSSVDLCVMRQGGTPTDILRLYNLIYYISETFNVSEEAARNRLKTLGYLNYLLQQTTA